MCELERFRLHHKKVVFANGGCKVGWDWVKEDWKSTRSFTAGFQTSISVSLSEAKFSKWRSSRNFLHWNSDKRSNQLLARSTYLAIKDLELDGSFRTWKFHLLIKSSVALKFQK